MKTPNKYLIGIDSGASSTDAIVCTRSGEVALSRKFPALNYNVKGSKESVKLLTKIIGQITKKIGAENVSGIVIGIAGARHKKDRDNIKKQLLRSCNVKNIHVLPDTEIALASIFDKNEKNCGILIAGTGSILYYRDGKGKLNRVGGWGRHIGDEGSGYWIGKEALNRLGKYHDGTGKSTKLQFKLKKHFGIDNRTLIKKVYHENFEISRIAKHVFDCAEEGDGVSEQIIKEAAEHLANHLLVLKNTKMKIALVGSLFTEEKLLEKYLKKITKKYFPDIKLIKPDLKPVWGAVRIGMEKNMSDILVVG